VTRPHDPPDADGQLGAEIDGDRTQKPRLTGSTLRDLGVNTTILTIAAAVGQVFGVARELFVGSQMGVSAELDGLLIALVGPTVFAGLLGSGTAAALAPAYVSIQARAGREEALRFLGSLLTWIGIVAVALVALLILFPAPVVSIAGPGLDETGRASALRFIPLFAPILLMTSISGLLGVVLQLENRFREIALTSSVGPVVSMLVTVGLWTPLGLGAFAIGLVLNAAASLGVLILVVWRSGLLPPPSLALPRRDAADFLRHAGPLTVSALALQMNLVVDRAIASMLGVGSVSLLRYAENIVRLPLNTLGPAWSKVIYPALVRSSVDDASEPLGVAAHRAMRYVLALFVPIAIGTAALAPLIVGVAYERGAFDAADTRATATVLAGFAPLVALIMIQAILVGAHNTRRRGAFLMAAGFANALLNLVLDLFLGSLIGVAGVALASSITVTILLFAMARRLDNTEPEFMGRVLASVLVRTIIASAAAALPVALVVWASMGAGIGLRLGLLVTLPVVGLLVYVSVARRLGLNEPAIVTRTVWQTVTTRIRH
jgi:putative peptidoglycan lipid II flippase